MSKYISHQVHYLVLLGVIAISTSNTPISYASSLSTNHETVLRGMKRMDEKFNEALVECNYCRFDCEDMSEDCVLGVCKRKCRKDEGEKCDEEEDECDKEKDDEGLDESEDEDGSDDEWGNDFDKDRDELDRYEWDKDEWDKDKDELDRDEWDKDEWDKDKDELDRDEWDKDKDEMDRDEWDKDEWDKDNEDKDKCVDTEGQFKLGKRMKKCTLAKTPKHKLCKRKLFRKACPVSCDACDDDIIIDSGDGDADGVKIKGKWMPCSRATSPKHRLCRNKKFKKVCNVCDGNDNDIVTDGDGDVDGVKINGKWRPCSRATSPEHRLCRNKKFKKVCNVCDGEDNDIMTDGDGDADGVKN